jgi:hypothetical protein
MALHINIKIIDQSPGRATSRLENCEAVNPKGSSEMHNWHKYLISGIYTKVILGFLNVKFMSLSIFVISSDQN